MFKVGDQVLVNKNSEACHGLLAKVTEEISVLKGDNHAVRVIVIEDSLNRYPPGTAILLMGYKLDHANNKQVKHLLKR